MQPITCDNNPTRESVAVCHLIFYSLQCVWTPSCSDRLGQSQPSDIGRVRHNDCTESGPGSQSVDSQSTRGPDGSAPCMQTTWGSCPWSLPGLEDPLHSSPPEDPTFIYNQHKEVCRGNPLSPIDFVSCDLSNVVHRSSPLTFKCPQRDLPDDEYIQHQKLKPKMICQDQTTIL